MGGVAGACMICFLRHSVRQDRAPSDEVQWHDRDSRPFDTPISDHQLPNAAVAQLARSEFEFSLQDCLVVCSPYRRCLETCAAVLEACGSNHVIIDDRVGENWPGFAHDVEKAGGDSSEAQLVAQPVTDQEVQRLLGSTVSFEHYALTQQQVAEMAGSVDAERVTNQWASMGNRLPLGQPSAHNRHGIEHWTAQAAARGRERPVLVVTHYGVVCAASQPTCHQHPLVPHTYCCWVVLDAQTGERLGQNAPGYEQKAASEQAQSLMDMFGCSAAQASLALAEADDFDQAACYILDKPQWLVDGAGW